MAIKQISRWQPFQKTLFWQLLGAILKTCQVMDYTAEKWEKFSEAKKRKNSEEILF